MVMSRVSDRLSKLAAELMSLESQIARLLELGADHKMVGLFSRLCKGGCLKPETFMDMVRWGKSNRDTLGILIRASSEGDTELFQRVDSYIEDHIKSFYSAVREFPIPDSQKKFLYKGLGEVLSVKPASDSEFVGVLKNLL